jgi:hypothetical protein
LPFFELANSEMDRFVTEGQGDDLPLAPLRHCSWSDLRRDFSPCVDRWSCGSFSWTIHSPYYRLPDPALPGVDGVLSKMLLPAVFGVLRLDNRDEARARRVFIGYQPGPQGDHLRENWELRQEGISALSNGAGYGMACDHPGCWTAQHFDPRVLLAEQDRERFHFGNGSVGLISCMVPAGACVELRVVLGFYRAGVVTSGRSAVYAYTRHHAGLADVWRAGFVHFEDHLRAAAAADAALVSPSLSADQRFHLAQSVRAYAGSTQLLQEGERALWVVNEGEYRMINTLDLLVDHAFWELRIHPWTLRQALDLYLTEYAYVDRVRLPGEALAYPGGLTFCHDMGVGNAFSRPGHSCYEIGGLKGCFSYMSAEQVLNWFAVALLYVEKSGDAGWRDRNMAVFFRCFESCLQRDHPLPELRDGVVDADSERVEGGAEITTYDSLDASLGQARRSAYLCVKSWAVCSCFARMLEKAGDPDAAFRAREQAKLSVRSLLAWVQFDGSIPALLQDGCSSRIISVVEGLAIAWHGGVQDELQEKDGIHASLLASLRGHLDAVMCHGLCLFPDGAWKLSSSSVNSWLSKVYLCQFVCRAILGWQGGGLGDGQADAAHAAWLKDSKNAFWAWGDQFYSGVLRGSKYYPRGVTSILWLDEAEKAV